MVQKIIPRDDFDIATILRESNNVESWYKTAYEAIEVAAKQAREQVCIQPDRGYNKISVHITTYLICDQTVEDSERGVVLDTRLNTIVHR
jgi:hypothetical protein